MHTPTATVLALALALTLPACPDDADAVDPAVQRAAAIAAVDWTRMKTHVDVLADDAMGGRIPGSVGHDAARAYLLAEIEALGLEPFGDAGGYVQTYPQEGRSNRYQLTADGEVVPNVAETGYNLVARLPGADPALADEHVVLMGHYDHIGVNAGGDPYNGAFDNAGGAAVLLGIARAMRAHDVAPARSVVFLWTDGEETGLDGADHWIMNPPVPREDIVIGISADPVGRGILPDYGPLVLMGLERSPTLRPLFETAGAAGDLPVTFLHRDVVLGFASDQDTFHDAGVPGVWFVTPGMTFYHTVDDAAETLDYRVLLGAARYLMRVVLAVGDAPGAFPYQEPPAVDVDDLADARVILEGVLGSTVLTASERDRAEAYVDQIDAALAAGSLDALGTDPIGFFLPVVAFAAFELSASHPGEIPPPTP